MLTVKRGFMEALTPSASHRVLLRQPFLPTSQTRNNPDPLLKEYPVCGVILVSPFYGFDFGGRTPIAFPSGHRFRIEVSDEGDQFFRG